MARFVRGPTAIVLVYACADARWLSKYNPKDDLLDARLSDRGGIRLARGAVLICVDLRIREGVGTSSEANQDRAVRTRRRSVTAGRESALRPDA